MSSIFIDTLTHRWRAVDDQTIVYGRPFDHTFIPFNNGETRMFSGEIINSLLLHDKILIKIDALEEVIQLLGIEPTWELLKRDILSVIDDGGTMTGFMPNGNDNLLLNFSNATALEWATLQKRLHQVFNGKFGKQFIDKLLLSAEQSAIQVDGAWLGHLANKEVEKDIGNAAIRGFLHIQNEYDNIIFKDEDTLAAMRLSYLNNSLVYQHELKIDYLLTEVTAQHLIELKFGMFFNPQAQSIPLFQSILKDKQLPDLSDLYVEGLISMDDVLKLRDNLDGKKFRNWFFKSDYDKAEIYKLLLSHESKLKDRAIVKIIRWIYPNLVGINSGFLGNLALSAIDSFVVEKLLSGWHPSLFLDDRLGATLNKAIRDRSIRRTSALEHKYSGKAPR